MQTPNLNEVRVTSCTPPCCDTCGSRMRFIGSLITQRPAYTWLVDWWRCPGCKQVTITRPCDE